MHCESVERPVRCYEMTSCQDGRFVFSIKRASAVGGGSCVREGSYRPCVADSLLLLAEGWTEVILRD